MSEEPGKTAEELAVEVTKLTTDLEAARKVISDSEAGQTLDDAKKYRERAQKAEEQLVKVKDEQEKLRLEGLEKKEEWKQLAEERKAKIDELNPQVEEYSEYKKTKREDLLKLLPDDESRELYGDLSLIKLEAHVIKIGIKPVVPGVDNTTPGEAEAMGFETPQAAALALNKGEIKQDAYDKIIKFFRSKIQR